MKIGVPHPQAVTTVSGKKGLLDEAITPFARAV